ncbi:MAG: TetR/AcrR family transcriptional regulator [Betaproteobacteria bacterium]|jgi:AcrR family transcriptional regulator|nr:TetR/AcrR family transcriptional regulator [Rubrivivax sp.]
MHFPATFSLAADYQAACDLTTDRSERTRLRVLAVTVAVLDKSTSTHVLPAELAREVGISRPLLYHHFGDPDGLLATIARDFAQRNIAFFRQLPSGSQRYTYPALVGYLAWILATAVRNRGAMRLMFGLTDRVASVNAVFGDLLHDLNKTLGEQLQPPGHVPVSATDRLLLGYMEAEGFNALLRSLFVYPNEHLPRLDTPQALFDLVQLVAGHRYRLVHGGPAPARDVKAVQQHFDLAFFKACFEQPSVLTTLMARPGRRR